MVYIYASSKALGELEGSGASGMLGRQFVISIRLAFDKQVTASDLLARQELPNEKGSLLPLPQAFSRLASHHDSFRPLDIRCP